VFNKDVWLEAVRSLCYEKRTVKLASGLESDFYIDMKQVLLNAKWIEWMSQAFLELLERYRGQIKGVGGMTMGADPIVTAVSLRSSQNGWPLNGFYIRKEPKSHGTSRWVEGLKNFSVGDKVIIMEDVVTTGGSSLKAVERAEEAGLQVLGIIACVDREEGGREKIEERGLRFHSLTTKSEILAR